MSSISTLSPLVAARHARLAKLEEEAANAAIEIAKLEKDWVDRIAIYEIIKLASQSRSAAAEMLEWARATEDDEDIRAAEAHLAHMQLLHEAIYRRYKGVVEWLGVAATQ